MSKWFRCAQCERIEKTGKDNFRNIYFPYIDETIPAKICEHCHSKMIAEAKKEVERIKNHPLYLGGKK